MAISYRLQYQTEVVRVNIDGGQREINFGK